MDVFIDTNNRTVTLNMDVNAREHLEFYVDEDFDGTFRVSDILCDGWHIVYAGFPTREDAERFVLNQPECFEQKGE